MGHDFGPFDPEHGLAATSGAPFKPLGRKSSGLRQINQPLTMRAYPECRGLRIT